MKPIYFHPAAEEELEKALFWYEEQRSGLGREFQTEVDAALDRIRRNPQGYGLGRRDFRACPLHRFPYTIYYADLEDHIWLAAVAHQSRRPSYWARRHPE